MPVQKRDGIWRVRFAVDGHRYQFSAGKGATKAQAQALEAQARRDIIEGKINGPKYSLADAAVRWLEGEGKHLKDYEKNVKTIALIREFLDVPITEAPDAAQGIINKWPNLKPATINRRLAIIRRLCNLAWKWQWIKNPIKIELLPGEEERHVYLNIQQVVKLAKRCGPAKWHIIVYAFTGLRESELLNLRPEYIHNDVIILPPSMTKSKRPRVIPLIAPAKAAIQRMDWNMTYQTLRTNWERARAELGMQHVRIHDIRHTCASLMVKSGASLVAVRDLLGHANLAVTSRYSHLASEGLRAETEKMLGTKMVRTSKNGQKKRHHKVA